MATISYTELCIIDSALHHSGILNSYNLTSLEQKEAYQVTDVAQAILTKGQFKNPNPMSQVLGAIEDYSAIPEGITNTFKSLVTPSDLGTIETALTYEKFISEPSPFADLKGQVITLQKVAQVLASHLQTNVPTVVDGAFFGTNDQTMRGDLRTKLTKALANYPLAYRLALLTSVEDKKLNEWKKQKQREQTLSKRVYLNGICVKLLRNKKLDRAYEVTQIMTDDLPWQGLLLVQIAKEHFKNNEFNKTLLRLNEIKECFQPEVYSSFALEILKAGHTNEGMEHLKKANVQSDLARGLKFIREEKKSKEVQKPLNESPKDFLNEDKPEASTKTEEQTSLLAHYWNNSTLFRVLSFLTVGLMPLFVFLFGYMSQENT